MHHLRASRRSKIDTDEIKSKISSDKIKTKQNLHQLGSQTYMISEVVVQKESKTFPRTIVADKT